MTYLEHQGRPSFSSDVFRKTVRSVAEDSFQIGDLKNCGSGFFFINLLMEQHDLKNVNNFMNTNIYSYLETARANVIKLLQR